MRGRLTLFYLLLFVAHFSFLIKVFLSVFGDLLGISVRRHYAALGEIGFELIKQRREVKDSTQVRERIREGLEVFFVIFFPE